MARDLTAVQVVITLHDDGRAKYPDFNSLPAVQATGMDWSVYVDRHGLGWHYDQLSGHKDDDPPDSPLGQQNGMLLVPEQFAIEAVAAFPALCRRLTELQCQDFFDNRAHVRERENHEDTEVLQAIHARESLAGVVPGPDPVGRRAEDKKALDPNDPTPGIRKNHNRFWSDFKARRGVVFIESR